MLGRLYSVFGAWLLMWTFSSVAICDDGTRVSVLSFDPGTDLFAAFGHIALVVEKGSAPPKVYNFGNYDFASDDAVWRYAKGELEYWVSVSTLASTLRHYRHFDRGAVLRRLELSDDQARRLIEAIEIATLPENRRYRYNHTTNNCCTRVRDLLNEATGGLLSARFEGRPASRTYRQWLRALLADRPGYGAFLDVSLGPSVDRPITRYEEEFLPQVLGADLDEVRREDGRPLVAAKEQILPRRDPPERCFSWLAWLMAFSLGLGALGIALGIRPRPWKTRLLGALIALFGLFSGLAGSWFVFLCLGEHADAHSNANALLLPITHLWLVVPGLSLFARGRLGTVLGKWTRRYWMVTLAAAGGASVLSIFGYQDNLAWVMALLPAIGGLAVAGWASTCLSHDGSVGASSVHTCKQGGH